MKFYDGTCTPIKEKIKASVSRFVQDFKDMLNPEYEEPWEMFPEDFDTDEEWEAYQASITGLEEDDDEDYLEDGYED